MELICLNLSDGINMFKSVEIREWTNKKSNQIYELLAEGKIELARKTIKSMFAELTIQAYR